MKPVLIIINGLPATGKTTLAASLAKKLSLASLGKDMVKEFLFDHIGIGDTGWSKSIGALSTDLLYEIAEIMLANQRSVIIESAFENKFAVPKLAEIIHKYSPTVLEVYCTTESTVRRKRFQERITAGNRHPGHHDGMLDTPESEVLKKYAPLRLGELLEVDTTEISDQLVSDTVNQIARRLALNSSE